MNPLPIECDRDDIDWCHDRLRRFPDAMRRRITGQYNVIFRRQGRRNANLSLLELSEKLDSETIRLASSDDDLIKFAERRATEADRMRVCAPTSDAAFSSLVLLVTAHRLQPPRITQNISIEGALNRMTDPRWWRRAVRKAHARRFEYYAIKLGFVQRKADKYVSADTLKRRQEQQARNRALLETLVAISNEGETLDLIELVEHSNANPKIRRAELMVRLAGFERIANDMKCCGLFLTLTCPARFHAVLSASGEANPSYVGTSPRDGQRWLSQNWARIRATLLRRGIKAFGFRIAEPHHDGTPHWHLILFVTEDQKQALIEVMRAYLLQDSGDEAGARKHRFKVKEIDPKKGSATGYVAKYISKNIAGSQASDSTLNDGAVRVDAWAATWGIRQFQQIGGPPVTLWREMRRLKPTAVPGPIKAACVAADNGDWASFVHHCGGAFALRNARPFFLIKVQGGTAGRYGDYSTARYIGIRVGNVTVLTRFRTWTIMRRGLSETGPPNSSSLEYCQ